VYAARKEDAHLPVREVAAVDIFDGKLCVWRKGEAEAVLRVPAGSPNALVMGRVLQQLMPPADAEGEPADGLGRIIFERDQSIRGGNRIAGIFTIALGVGIGLVLLTVAAQGRAWPTALIGMAFWAACAGGAV